MKTSTTIFILIAVFPLLIFSQNTTSFPPEEFLIERMSKFNIQKFAGSEMPGDRRAQHFKSMQVVREKLLRSINETRTIEQVFEANNIKTSIINILLENDFLLIEWLNQNWDGARWKERVSDTG